MPSVHDVLGSRFADYEIRELLHDVPPHATYEVVVDGTRAVCKLARSDEGDPAMEGRVMEYLVRETAVPVPEVLAVGPNYYVAAWDDRVPTKGRAVGEVHVRAMGAGLATLHDETAGDFDAYGSLHAGDGGLELDARGGWRETVMAFLSLRGDYLETVGHGDVAAAALAFVREHPDLFGDPDGPVLCHGNFHPDHVGIADGVMSTAIDFEHALVGTTEYDFWRAALPLRMNEGEEAVEWFRAGYESGRALPDGFDRRREVYAMVNAVSYLRSLSLQNQHAPAETERRAEWFRERVFEAIDSFR